MTTTIREADLSNEADGMAILSVLDSYATDSFGGSAPLAEDVKQRLLPALRQHPTTVILLAFKDEKAVGLANCFLGFSTFQARPLLNIHDLAVLPQHRGQGVGRALLNAVEATAAQRGCCKLTLEVLDNNARAIGLYESFGFTNYTLGDSKSTRFLDKAIAS